MRVLQVRVKPNARHSELRQAADGTWLAHLKAPPVGGKANVELIRLVAEHFDRPPSKVTIRRGATGRVKRLHIED